MKKAVLTVEISTKEALEGVLTEPASVLYISAKLYLQMHSTILSFMLDHGFAEQQLCRRGVIFVRTQGPQKFDPDRQYYTLPPVEMLR